MDRITGVLSALHNVEVHATGGLAWLQIALMIAGLYLLYSYFKGPSQSDVVAMEMADSTQTYQNTIRLTNGDTINSSGRVNISAVLANKMTAKTTHLNYQTDNESLYINLNQVVYIDSKPLLTDKREDEETC